MIYGIEEHEMKKPEVLGARSVGLAVALHVVSFLLLYLFAMLHLKPRETVIPIDLTVVVNENLDGEENEPPPLDNPPPKVEPPKPTPPPAPPKVEEKIEAVEQIVDKKPEKPKEKPKEEKPKEEKKPDPPKPPEKTKEQLMQERLERMRNSAKEVKNPPKIIVKDKPSGNGKTDKQTLDPKQIEKLLLQGVKPGTKTQLAPDEKSRCVSLIIMALQTRWNQMSPKIGREGTVQLGIRFDGAGRIVERRLIKSCGDSMSDKAAYSVVDSLSRVDGLGPEFLSVHSKEMVIINYKVRAK